MKKPNKIVKTFINTNTSSEGETIEQQVERLVSNNEPTEGEAPLVYMERKEGIRAECNIRTDRWEIAIDAMDKVDKSYKARREEREAEKAKGEQGRGEGKRDDGEPESMQGTKGAK